MNIKGAETMVSKPKKPRQIARMVEWSGQHGGYIYQIEHGGPVWGPFKTREGAVCDAGWRLHLHSTVRK